MTPWWLSDSLSVGPEALLMDGVSLDELAREHGTPLYVYSRASIHRQLECLRKALSQATDDFRIYYAMKANRCPGVLSAVREVPGTGVDACSPREVSQALQQGFPVDAISFNACMLSNRDLAYVAERGLYSTLDSFSALRRLGARAPRGTRVGLRLDPGVKAGYSQSPGNSYGGAKFGFELEEVGRALAVATEAGLRVDGVHMHIGWGLPETAGKEVDRAFGRLAQAARMVPGLRAVNVGGGLGGRFRDTDQPLQLMTWIDSIRRHLAPLEVTIACEPGTYVTRPSGVLLVEVNTVEERRGVHWIGVDAGYAVNPLPALYQINLEVVPLCRPLAPPERKYRVVGNINDVTDVWALECPLRVVNESERLALLPAGAYGASMSSDHCLRGQPREMVI